MFSIARSRYALSAQFLFLGVNGLGLLFGVTYNVNTPDMYVHNAHHSIGWVATWMATALVITNLLFLYSRRNKRSATDAGERAAFLPVSVQNMAQHNSQPYADYRWSGHSRQGSSDSSTLHSPDDSPTVVGRRDTFDTSKKPEPEPEDDDDEELQLTHKPVRQLGWLRIDRIAFFDKYLPQRMPRLVSYKVLRTIKLVYNVTDRLILLLGYIAMVTGFITYCGLFVSPQKLTVIERSPRVGNEVTNNNTTESQQRLHRPRALYQRRNFLLVRSANARTLDGVLCRSRLGMESKAEPCRGRPMEIQHSVGGVHRVLCHLAIRRKQRLPRASYCLGSSVVRTGFGACVHCRVVLWCWIGMFRGTSTLYGTIANLNISSVACLLNLPW